MNRQNFVEYVVGSILCFPLRIIHILPVEKVERNPNTKKAIRTDLPEQNKRFEAKNGGKRTCGQSQKSVRIKHSSIPALKKK